MTNKTLNSIGLFFGMAGVCIIFFYGPPQPDLSLGVGIGLSDGNIIDNKGTTVKQHDIEVSKLRETHSKWSAIGLILIGIGFLLQFVSVWTNDLINKYRICRDYYCRSNKKT